MLLKIITGLL